MSSAKSIYLINPAADFPTYYGAEVYAGRGYQRAAFLADLVVPTLAAMVPTDFHVELCDEQLEDVNWDTPCEYIGITGKVSQWGRTKAIADEFRRRGKTVLIGGPHASLSPEVVRPHCDILVRDEIELIVDELFSDLAHREWQAEYVGGGRPKIRVRLQARLVRLPRRTSIRTTSEDVVVTAEDSSLDAIVRAFDVAFGRAAKRIGAWTIKQAAAAADTTDR